MGECFRGTIGDWGIGHMGFLGFGWIFIIIFWTLIILGVVAVFRWIIKQGKSEEPGKDMPRSALDILQERYAKGEINKQEFEEKKKDLEK